MSPKLEPRTNRQQRARYEQRSRCWCFLERKRENGESEHIPNGTLLPCKWLATLVQNEKTVPGLGHKALRSEHDENVREEIEQKTKKLEKRWSHTNYSLLMGFSEESFGAAAPNTIRQTIYSGCVCRGQCMCEVNQV